MAKMEVQTNWLRNLSKLTKSGRVVYVVLGGITIDSQCSPVGNYFLASLNKCLQGIEHLKTEQLVG